MTFKCVRTSTIFLPDGCSNFCKSNLRHKFNNRSHLVKVNIKVIAHLKQQHSSKVVVLFKAKPKLRPLLEIKHAFHNCVQSYK